MSQPKPRIAGGRSIKMLTPPGTYAWCACGHSNQQPFCDGSHRKVEGFTPLKVVLPNEQHVKWCACKMTKTPPFCDHSHRDLPGYSPGD